MTQVMKFLNTRIKEKNHKKTFRDVGPLLDWNLVVQS